MRVTVSLWQRQMAILFTIKHPIQFRGGSTIFLRRGLPFKEWRHWRWGKKILKADTYIRRRKVYLRRGCAPPAPSLLDPPLLGITKYQFPLWIVTWRHLKHFPEAVATKTTIENAHPRDSISRPLVVVWSSSLKKEEVNAKCNYLETKQTLSIN